MKSNRDGRLLAGCRPIRASHRFPDSCRSTRSSDPTPGPVANRRQRLGCLPRRGPTRSAGGNSLRLRNASKASWTCISAGSSGLSLRRTTANGRVSCGSRGRNITGALCVGEHRFDRQDGCSNPALTMLRIAEWPTSIVARGAIPAARNQSRASWWIRVPPYRKSADTSQASPGRELAVHAVRSAAAPPASDLHERATQ